MAAEELTSGYRGTLTIYREGGNLVFPVSKDDGGANLEAVDGRRRDPVTGKQYSIGGTRSRGTIEVQIAVKLYVWRFRDAIDDSAGRDRYLYVKQAVDGRGRVTATVLSVGGTLGSPSWPEFDLDGDDDETFLVIESGADE